jgi:PAS domain S-box-containing protein
LIITIIVSFIIAKIVSRPLERMTNEAAKIAHTPSNMFLNEEKAEYFEFKKLCGAFNQVLSSLFKAQEELKSETRKELEASEERYRLTVEAAPDGIVLIRLYEGIILQANDTFLGMTGYAREEIIGRTTIELSLYQDPLDREKVYDALEEKGEVNNLEIKFRGKNGRVLDCLLSIRKIMFHGEDCAIVVISDNSEQKEAEDKIRDSYNTLQLILDSMPTCIIIVGIDRRIRHANRAALKLLGYHSEEDVKGKICHRFICTAEEGRCPICDLKQTIDRSERVVLASDGRRIPIYKSVIPVILNNEDVLIEAFFDLTEFKKADDEKKRLESALQRASKMEAIGAMAGGVAHDLNNILSGLVGYPELLLMDLPEDSPLKKPILTIQKSGEKAAAIVQDMLTLARRGVAVTEVVNLNTVIREYLKIPEHKRMMAYHNDVHLKLDLEPNLLNIIGSEVHLSKTLMNMVSNSLEAMSEGGEISISTKNEYIDVPARGYDNVNEGDYVVLIVSDNGSGILPEDQEKIFEPFYTKKKMGRSGTGLGMAVVWGTVKDHDGYIDLKSDIGKGSTFKLYFPVTRKELIKEESELMIEKYMGRGESVLVVDDIPEQREIAYSMLSKLGYTVATVSSGEDAIEYMKQSSADILVLDMIMAPGIDGLETYKRILEKHPGQKAVVASGFSETEKVREAQRLGAGAYIKKPYLMKNIGPAIRKELDK